MRRAERKGLGWSDGLLRWSRPQLLKRLHRVSETIDLNERFLQERCHNGVEAIRVVKRNHVRTIGEDLELRVGNVMEASRKVIDCHPVSGALDRAIVISAPVGQIDLPLAPIRSCSRHSFTAY